MTDPHAWLAFLHILGATVWVGAWVAICVFAVDAVRHPEPAVLRRLFGVMRTLGPTVIGPATLLVLGAGIALVARSTRTAWSDRWIVVGLALYALVTLIGVVGLSRASVRATRALDEGDLAAAVGATRIWLRLAVAVAAVLVLATADMVFRP